MRAIELPRGRAHGTAISVKFGCGCEVCAAAIPHGTQSGYINWECRCDACRWAHRPHAPCRKCGSEERRPARRLVCDTCRAAWEADQVGRAKISTPEWRAKISAGVRAAQARRLAQKKAATS